MHGRIRFCFASLGALLALALTLVSGCGASDSAPAQGGAAQGGAAQGGAAQGGAAQGGAAQGGAAQGGAAQAGGQDRAGASSAGTNAVAGGAGGGGAPSLAGNGGTMGRSGSAGVAGSALGGAGASAGTSSGAGAGGATAGASGSGSGSAGTGGAGGTYHPCPSDGSACKIMPFGDSITDGYGTEGSYRIELFRLAHQAGKNITFVGSQSNGPSMVDGVPFPPQHEGHSGFTIYPTPSRSGISPFVDSSIPQFAPHIVCLMIGTNDAIDDYQMANAPARLGMLIDSIFAKLPKALLVVAQPIPSQDEALNTRLRTYGAAIPAIAKARADAGKHILVVDLYTPFAAVADYKTSLLKDTWHPNVAGDVILGQHWYSALAGSL